MANEAIIRHKSDLPINFATQNERAIEKGQILRLIDERTVSGTQVSGMAIAGICAREKILDDGRPVAVYRRGIFDMVVSGGVVAPGGKLIMNDPAQGDNTVGAPNSPLVVASGAVVLGTAMGTLTADSSETMQVSVNL